MPTHSSELLAMTSVLSKGYIPVRILFGTTLIAKRTEIVLQGELVVHAATKSLHAFTSVQNGRVDTVNLGPLRLTDEIERVVVFAIRYIGEPRFKSEIDSAVGGPLCLSWDDLDAGSALFWTTQLL